MVDISLRRSGRRDEGQGAEFLILYSFTGGILYSNIPIPGADHTAGSRGHLARSHERNSVFCGATLGATSQCKCKCN